MEHYKKTLKHRMLALTMLALICIALILYVVFTGIPENNGLISGFQTGLATSMLGVSIFCLIRYKKVLGDEKKIQMSYNLENDERNKAIASKAGMPMVLYLSIGLIIAALIAGYFNVVVFWTLVATAFFQLVSGTIAKLYYNKKM